MGGFYFLYCLLISYITVTKDKGSVLVLKIVNYFHSFFLTWILLFSGKINFKETDWKSGPAENILNFFFVVNQPTLS